MNAIDYLIDEDGVIQAKGKEVKLRPLDKLRTRDERTFWQILNIGLPVVLVLIFGFVLQWWRKEFILQTKRLKNETNSIFINHSFDIFWM